MRQVINKMKFNYKQKIKNWLKVGILSFSIFMGGTLLYTVTSAFVSSILRAQVGVGICSEGFINVKCAPFNAKGDGVTDDTAAFTSAFAMHQIVFAPAGIYKFDSNLVLTDVPLLMGVPGRTILRPSALVSGIFLSVNTTIRTDTSYYYPSILQGIDIDGSLTTNVTGLKIGTSGISAQIFLNEVEGYGFKVGLHVADVVHFKADKCNFSKNGSNKIDAFNAFLPTVADFKSTTFILSSVTLGTGIGLDITHGLNIIVDGCIIENNDKEGLKAVIGNNQIANISVSGGGWFEANQASEGTPSNFYHIYLDGTSGGATGKIDFKIDKTNMSLSAGSPKGIYATSTFIFDIGEMFISSGAQSGSFNFVNSFGKIKFPYYWGNPNYFIIKDAASIIDVSENVYFQTIPNGTVIPNLNGGVSFLTANAALTTINDFSMSIGQRVNVYIRDANTIIDFTGTNLKGNAGADWSPVSGDWMEVTFDGTFKYCAVHH